MEALLGSKSNGGGKAVDLAWLLIAEAALKVQRSLFGLAIVMLSLQNEIFTSSGEQDLINRILGKHKNESVLENKDDGESDYDNEEEGDDEDAINQYDDDDDDGNDEDASEEEGNDEDEDNDLEANGEGGSDEEDGGGDEEDEDGDEGEDDDEENEDEEEEDEDSDDVPQPPAKKRK